MKITFGGDFCPRGRTETIISQGDGQSLFNEILPILQDSDYNIINLECPVITSNCHPISKLGPNLSCGPASIELLSMIGIDCVALANNHINDYGATSIATTLSTCERYGLDYVGVGPDYSKAIIPLEIRIGAKLITIINCCEHEYSIASSGQAGACPVDPTLQYKQIVEAKKNSDYVIVIVHGGHEHWQYPSTRMVDTYRFYIEVGADAVVNHHQHCFSGFEYYLGKPIFYGIGNLCFDSIPIVNESKWNYGFLLQIDIDDDGKISHEIFPYIQSGDVPGIQLISKNSFDSQLESINETISNRVKLETVNNQFYKGFEKDIFEIIQPLQNRLICSLRYRGLLPTIKSKKWLINLENFTMCESHRDIMEYFFRRNHE